MDGALALATPTRFGQSLRIQETDSQTISWISYAVDGEIWFEGTFDLPTGGYLSGADADTGQRLEQIFQAIQKQRANFWSDKNGLAIETRLEFPRAWGLGTSSTLISMLADWAQINPYQLLADSFGGSGYDLACAQAQGPILYERFKGQGQAVHYPFMPAFQENLYFIYLGKKQNSREGIKRYRETVKEQTDLVRTTTELTHRFLHANHLEELEQVIVEHESHVAQAIHLPQVKELYFSDYWGQVKSLGAWGGDFVLATSNRNTLETKAYFAEREFNIIFSYQELVLDKG